MAAPKLKAGSPPASASVCFQQRGFCPRSPCLHGSGRNATMEEKPPRERAKGPGVTAHSPGAHILALGQSPDGRNEQRVREKIRSWCRR